MAWRARISAVIRELHLTFCPKSIAPGKPHFGANAFLRKNYEDLKLLNPTLPIIVREGPGAAARLTASYACGGEESVDLEGLDVPAIETHLKSMVEVGERDHPPALLHDLESGVDFKYRKNFEVDDSERPAEVQELLRVVNDFCEHGPSVLPEVEPRGSYKEWVKNR